MFTLQSVVATFILLVIEWTVMTPGDPIRTTSRSFGDKVSLIRGVGESCRSFVRHAGSVSLRGDSLRKIGEGYQPSECRQACLETTEFVCTAAQLQLPATCFVTGYRLRNDYASDHYVRTCDSGPQCFRRMVGMSAGFTKSITIPRQYLSNPDVYPMFCMAACELGSWCVGFDVLNEEGRPRCAFNDFRLFASSSFDLYIRQCS